MATLITMDVRPITTPHLDLDHLPLVENDFQMKDTTILEPLLKVHCQSRDKFLNHADEIGLWESFPRYQFPKVHIFLKIVNMCYACYVPSHKTVMSHEQKVLFTFTTESINEML